MDLDSKFTLEDARIQMSIMPFDLRQIYYMRKVMGPYAGVSLSSEELKELSEKIMAGFAFSKRELEIVKARLFGTIFDLDKQIWYLHGLFAIMEADDSNRHKKRDAAAG